MYRFLCLPNVTAVFLLPLNPPSTPTAAATWSASRANDDELTQLPEKTTHKSCFSAVQLRMDAVFEPFFTPLLPEMLLNESLKYLGFPRAWAGLTACCPPHPLSRHRRALFRPGLLSCPANSPGRSYAPPRPSSSPSPSNRPCS